MDVLTYVPGILYGQWQQKMVETTSANKKIGDVYDKKGHILHLKNQHSRCSHQLKQQYLQKVSFHRRKEMSLMRCYYTHFIDVFRLPEIPGHLSLYEKLQSLTICLIFFLVGNVDTVHVK